MRAATLWDIRRSTLTVQIDVPKDLDDDAKKQLVSFVQKVRKREQND